MDMRFSRPFRQSLAAGVFALSLLAGIGGAAHVGAAEIDKGAFKNGCESGGGSYLENADGSFQCNTKSGSTIKCPNTTSQCVSIPMTWGGGTGAIFTLPKGGLLHALAVANDDSVDGSDPGNTGTQTTGQGQGQIGDGGVTTQPGGDPGQGAGKGHTSSHHGKKHGKHHRRHR